MVFNPTVVPLDNTGVGSIYCTERPGLPVQLLEKQKRPLTLDNHIATKNKTKGCRPMGTKRKYITRNKKKELGKRCINCGSTENIEYHHVVPLLLGGKDIDSNIVPLCYACHRAAHNGRHISEYKNGNKGGRKPMASPEEVKVAFMKYVDGEIGTRKLRSMLGYRSKGSVNEIAEVRRLKKKYQISEVKNNIDILGVNSPVKLVHGAVVGKIIYLDGSERPMFFNDTGLNDVEYIQRVQG